MRKPKNLPRHELIGLDVKVLESTNKDEVGVEGVVIDETKKMLKIQSGNEEKMIQKEGRVFKFRLPTGKGVKVDGGIIEGRPEERIQKKLKKW